jgi:2'-5' RNA ligase
MNGEPKRRLFVAVELPDAIRSAIEGMTEPLRSLEGFRWTPIENLHLTVAFLGWVEEPATGSIRDRVARAAAGVEPFEACLGVPGRFPERGKARVLWVGFEDPTDSLAALAAEVRTSIGQPFEPDDRPFRPHVTVARARRPVSMRLPEPTDPPSIPFPVDSITLFRTYLGGEHARYEALERWPLGAQPSRIP